MLEVSCQHRPADPHGTAYKAGKIALAASQNPARHAAGLAGSPVVEHGRPAAEEAVVVASVYDRRPAGTSDAQPDSRSQTVDVVTVDDGWRELLNQAAEMLIEIGIKIVNHMPQEFL
jgi:hypothetical protein